MSVKVYVLEKRSTAKLHSSIHKYFGKQREVDLYHTKVDLCHTKVDLYHTKVDLCYMKAEKVEY